jgi:hypothetical protein
VGEKLSFVMGAYLKAGEARVCGEIVFLQGSSFFSPEKQEPKPCQTDPNAYYFKL